MQQRLVFFVGVSTLLESLTEVTGQSCFNSSDCGNHHQSCCEIIPQCCSNASNVGVTNTIPPKTSILTVPIVKIGFIIAGSIVGIIGLIACIVCCVYCFREKKRRSPESHLVEVSVPATGPRAGGQTVKYSAVPVRYPVSVPYVPPPQAAEPSADCVPPSYTQAVGQETSSMASKIPLNETPGIPTENDG